MSNDKTHTPFVSESTRIKLPLPVLFALLTVVAAGAIAWGTTRQDVDRHEVEIRGLQSNAQQQREILIRIDERTAEIKRQMEARRD